MIKVLICSLIYDNNLFVGLFAFFFNRFEICIKFCLLNPYVEFTSKFVLCVNISTLAVAYIKNILQLYIQEFNLNLTSISGSGFFIFSKSSNSCILTKIRVRYKWRERFDE
jgi:hypothetical protein